MGDQEHKKKEKIFDHPERRDDEIYLGNFDYEGYLKIGWESKRMGTKSYLTNGKPLPCQEMHGMFPVFVKNKKILKNNG